MLTMRTVRVSSRTGAGLVHRSTATNCAAPAKTVALISAAATGPMPLPAASVPNSRPIGMAAATTGRMSNTPRRNSGQSGHPVPLSLPRRGGTTPPRRSPRYRGSRHPSTSIRHPGRRPARSVFFDTEPATLAPSRSAMALASSRVIRSSAPVKTTVLPATGEVASTAASGSTSTWRSRPSTTARLCVLGEEIGDGLGHGLADPADIVEVVEGLAVTIAGGLPHGGDKGLGRAIGARQQPRRGLADMPDAERDR